MLLSTHIPRDSEANYSSAHNYYERLVFEKISQKVTTEQQDSNFIADVACVALNHLPPRYVRHDVDMTFFLSEVEFEEIQKKVTKTVTAAIDYVDSRNTEKAKGSSINHK